MLSHLLPPNRNVKLERLRERRLIISHLQKFAHKISPTLRPKDMSFLQAIYC